MQILHQSKFSIENDLGLVSDTANRLASSARTFCHFSDREEFHIFISLVEAINNAIVHGNLEVDSKLRTNGVLYESTIEERRNCSPYNERSVLLRCQYTAEQAIIEIENEGPGFDPASVPDPTLEENLVKPSGRGLLIMKSYFSDVSFNETGTCLRLVKKVTHPMEHPPQLHPKQELSPKCLEKRQSVSAQH